MARAAGGAGSLALGSLFARDLEGPEVGVLQGAGGGVHRPAKAKRVVYLLQNGGPSHVDLFDHKPSLRAQHGEQIPDSFVRGVRFSSMLDGQGEKPLLGNLPDFASTRSAARRSRASCRARPRWSTTCAS